MQAAGQAVKIAEELTRVDAGNAMAWIALAYTRDVDLLDPNPALDKAARASRVHAYGFDLLKLAVEASGRLPIPAEALGKASPEALRWH